jgi:hypothetical protein
MGSGMVCHRGKRDFSPSYLTPLVLKMHYSVILGKKWNLAVKLGRNFFTGPNKEVNFKRVSNKEFSRIYMGDLVGVDTCRAWGFPSSPLTIYRSLKHLFPQRTGFPKRMRDSLTPYESWPQSRTEPWRKRCRHLLLFFIQKAFLKKEIWSRDLF